MTQLTYCSLGVKQQSLTHQNSSLFRLQIAVNFCTTTVTRWVPPLEQELPTLPENLSSPLIISVVRVARLLVFSVVFCRLLFVLFLLTIVLSVLRFTDSDYSFGIFKVFFFLGQVSNPIYFQSVLFKRKLKHNIKQPCLFSFIL